MTHHYDSSLCCTSDVTSLDILRPLVRSDWKPAGSCSLRDRVATVLERSVVRPLALGVRARQIDCSASSHRCSRASLYRPTLRACAAACRLWRSLRGGLELFILRVRCCRGDLGPVLPVQRRAHLRHHHNGVGKLVRLQPAVVGYARSRAWSSLRHLLRPMARRRLVRERSEALGKRLRHSICGRWPRLHTHRLQHKASVRLNEWTKETPTYPTGI